MFERLRKALDDAAVSVIGHATEQPRPDIGEARRRCRDGWVGLYLPMSRRGLVRVAVSLAHPIDRYRQAHGRPDVLLIALVDKLCATRQALDAVLDGDDRDASDIPEFNALADRHVALARAVCGTPAHGRLGLLAKARAVNAKDAMIRTDSAVAISMSLAVDVLTVEGAYEAAHRSAGHDR